MVCDRPVQALVDGGLPVEVARGYVAGHPELEWTADHCGQLVTDLTFRLPMLSWADGRAARTWVYDFRWPAPGTRQAMHCLELPFAWDLLDADGVAAVAGPNPPAALATGMHAAWVRFVSSDGPGWDTWNGHNPRVFGGEQRDSYAPERLLAAALAQRVAPA